MARGSKPPKQWLSDSVSFIDPRVSAVDIEVDTAVICSVEGFYPEMLHCIGRAGTKTAPRCNGAEKGRVARDFVIYKASVGSPSQGMLMDTLVASGVRRFIVLGIAGSLSPKCRIGDIVIPSWGIREEGTSYHYLAADVVPRPSSSLSKHLRQSLGRTRVLTGGIWTIDAPYRETRDKIKKYSRGGAIAIDMECTALMSIAMVRGVDMAAVLAISDELFGPEWVQGFGSKELSAARKVICRSMVAYLKR